MSELAWMVPACDASVLKCEHETVPGLVSVIIPAHNAGRFIARAIASIFAQRSGPFTVETLVCDDGSTDQTAAIVGKFCQADSSPVRLLRHSDGQNHGVGPARNLAIGQARGEFVAFLDADDEWLPDKLNRQIAYIRLHPTAKCVATHGFFIDEHGQRIIGPNGATLAGDFTHLLPPERFTPPYDFEQLLLGDPVLNSSLLVRRAAIEAAGGFPDLMAHQAEDWMLLAKLSLVQPIHLIPEPLIAYRFHPDSYTARFISEGYAYGARTEFLIHLVQWMLQHPEYALRGQQLFRREYPRLVCARGAAYQLIEDYFRHHHGNLKNAAEFEAHLAGLYAELGQLRAFAREREWALSILQRFPGLTRLYGLIRRHIS